MKKALNIYIVAILFTGFIGSCSDDNEDSLFRLQVDNTDVTITSAETPVIVTITSGNEGYTVRSADESIVKAEISGTSIILKGVGEGSTNVTVTDQEKRSVLIQVAVSFTLPESESFKWNGKSEEFDKPGKYGISILSGSIALTDLASEERKQVILSWSGGFTVGDKSDGKLNMLTPEGSEIMPLTSVKVIRADALGHYIIFSDGSKSGELFFFK